MHRISLSRIDVRARPGDRRRGWMNAGPLRIAVALGRAGINIVDMALSPSRDGNQGVVALWIRGEEQAQRAVELITALRIPVARP